MNASEFAQWLLTRKQRQQEQDQEAQKQSANEIVLRLKLDWPGLPLTPDGRALATRDSVAKYPS